MGLHLGFSGSGCKGSDSPSSPKLGVKSGRGEPVVSRSNPPQPPNPNPYNFRLVRREDHNGHSILLVHFPGCTTYNGYKVILTRTQWDGGDTMDPHFIGGEHPVLARFEPTKQGWALAKTCAYQTGGSSEPLITEE
jgi:hypothetical protein